MNKSIKFITTITLTLSVTVLVILILLVIPNTLIIINFSTQNPLLGPLLIILWRIVAIVVPPIPGGMVSLALIPVFGWWWSFVYAALGATIGMTIAFYLARKFREPLVKKFVPLQQLHQWEEKLSPKIEFLTFLGIRFATDPVFDFISYIAGLSKISFWKFFVANLIALLPYIFVYYLGGIAFRVNFYLGIAFLIIFVVIVYLIRKRTLLEEE